MSFAVKRAYEAPAEKDGRRVLVDLAPSTELRKWFGHEPERWPEFQKRYTAELRRAELRERLQALAALGKRGKVTLLFGARDEEHNQAVVLRDYLERLTAKKSSR